MVTIFIFFYYFQSRRFGPSYINNSRCIYWNSLPLCALLVEMDLWIESERDATYRQSSKRRENKERGSIQHTPQKIKNRFKCCRCFISIHGYNGDVLGWSNLFMNISSSNLSLHFLDSLFVCFCFFYLFIYFHWHQWVYSSNTDNN